MKSIEQLKRLATNPFYTFTEEEQAALAASASEQQAGGENSSPKFPTKGSAAVKQVGKLDKHTTDPVKE